MTEKKIIVLGPNPAYQKTLTFNRLQLDEVNRASQLRVYTGGKGTNFCRAAGCYRHNGHYCSTILFTFLGGATGEMVSSLLKEEGISVSAVKVDKETRTCVTCLDASSGTMTELIEPSFPVSAEAAAIMNDQVRSALAHADGLAIMGSLPDGSDASMYTAWTQIAADMQKPVLIDAVKGIEPSLKVPGAQSVLKVNLSELYKLTGASSPADAFRVAMSQWTIRVLAVTDGPRAAYIQERGGPLRKLTIPSVAGVVNPLGAGDTADAVFLSEFAHGTSPEKAFCRALAAASANCKQNDAGVFVASDMEEIVKSITVSDL